MNSTADPADTRSLLPREGDENKADEVRSPPPSLEDRELPASQRLDWRESEKPIAFLNLHLLQQVEMKGEYKRANPISPYPVITESSKLNSNPSLTNLHLTISITDILRIDPVEEIFVIKYRHYMMWEIDNIHQLGLSHYAEKVFESGHYYSLSRSEVDEFLSSSVVSPTSSSPPHSNPLSIPKLALFNAIETQETDLLDIRIYGRPEDEGSVAIMTNQSFTVKCRERFLLHHFPFDLQTLHLEFRLNDAKSWNTYHLNIDTVQFHEKSLDQLEWWILIPKVKRGQPKTANSTISIPIQRKSSYYMINVIAIVIILAALGLTTFAFQAPDLVGRTFIVFTLILTSIAFKFTSMADCLPKVPYSTLMDHFLQSAIWLLSIMTIFTIIPSFYVNDRHTPGMDHRINNSLAYVSIGLIVLIYGYLLLVARVTYNAHLRDHCTIPLEKDRPWYSFRFQHHPGSTKKASSSSPSSSSHKSHPWLVDIKHQVSFRDSLDAAHPLDVAKARDDFILLHKKG